MKLSFFPWYFPVALGVVGPVAAQTPAPPAAPEPPRPVEAPAEPSLPEPEPAPAVLPEVVVTERSTNLIGQAGSASQGTVGPEQIRLRPLFRPGELMESVPGLIVTQHSGGGKANQYFLRGFNLDHGTDFAFTVTGMPVNMRTHGHGQGYADLNFLIPELISGLEYRKGSYRADQGDFSSAGSAYVTLFDRLKNGLVEGTGGTLGYGRGVLVNSTKLGSGDLVYGLELYHEDGPWENPNDFKKVNGVLRYSRATERSRLALTGMAYYGDWNSTDQIPRRAVRNGSLGFYDTFDHSDGGRSHRYSFSGEWGLKGKNTQTEANAYYINYKMRLWSNFTYFLDDPVRGDQFEQADDRNIYGFNAAQHWDNRWGTRTMRNTLGFQFRHDDINHVGLFNTQRRRRFNTVRDDAVQESSLSPYLENQTRWTPKFRTIAGLRFDSYLFDVDSSIRANSGNTSDSILSPKLSLIFGPWSNTEYYLNLARGFHSNDARGTTIRVDPKTGERVSTVTPLVSADMAEIGVRTSVVKNLQSTLALWYLKFDSELLFVGDAGTTEASRPSRRVGLEFNNYYTPKKWLTLDADFAFSHARFSDSDPAGRRIPGAIEGVVSAGVAVDHPSGWFGALRLRYFGPRPLIEDNSVRSRSTSLVNFRVGRRLNPKTRVAFEIFNLFNSRDSDIDYYYTSRLQGERPQGRDDIHFHPVESRSFRFTLTREF